MSQIHQTALIESGAQIDESVQIGPYCVIGKNVTLDSNVRLHSHVVIDGHTHIGGNTEVFPFASLGKAPQDLKFGGEESVLEIGENNVIREYVTMNPGTAGDNLKTIVGNNNLFMISAHIAHDCVIGNNIVMANNATLGGHVHVGDYAVIGGLAAVHQFVRIGHHAVIGGMSGVENDVIPYGRVKGERAFLAGLNLIGLERQGFDKQEIKILQKAFNELFSGVGTLEERIQAVSDSFSGNRNVMELVAFAREKTRFPLCQPQKKAA